MSISKKIIEDSLLGDRTEVTDEIVEYYRNNPRDLDLIINKEYFHDKFIKFFFILGLVLTIGARLIQYFFKDTPIEFINDIVLDVFSELGIAVFGGAVTAYILEKMKNKQYQDNVKFRDQIMQRIKILEEDKHE